MNYLHDSQPLYSEKKIKNGFRCIIYTFKNYFIIIFSIFNKINIQPDSSAHDVTSPLGLGPLENKLIGLIYERQMLTGAVRLPLRLRGNGTKSLLV